MPISLPITLGEYLSSFPVKVRLCGLGQDTASLWAAFSSFIGTLRRHSEPCGLSWLEPQNRPERLANDPHFPDVETEAQKKGNCSPRSGSTLRAQQRMWVSTGHRCFLPRAETGPRQGEGR